MLYGYWPATLVSQASPGLPVHWHDHNVHAYLIEGTTDFLDAETGIRYNVGPRATLNAAGPTQGSEANLSTVAIRRQCGAW